MVIGTIIILLLHMYNHSYHLLNDQNVTQNTFTEITISQNSKCIYNIYRERSCIQI